MTTRHPLHRRLLIAVTCLLLLVGGMSAGLVDGFYRQAAPHVRPPLLLWALVVIITVVCCVLGAWIIISTFEPLWELLRRARGVAKGQLDLVVDSAVNNEIGELADCVDQVRRALVVTRNEQQQRTRSLLTLSRLSSRLSVSLDTASVAGTALELAITELSLRCGAVYLYDEAQQTLNLLAHRGLPVQSRAASLEMRVDQGFIGRPVQTGQLMLVDAIMARDWLAEFGMDEDGSLCVAAAPLRAGERVIGVMNLVGNSDPGLSPIDLEMLDAVGSQVGAALENARVYEESQRRLEHISGLLDISREVARSASSRGLLEIILVKVRELVGVDRCAIFRDDESRQRLVIANAVGLQDRFVRGVQYRRGQGAVGLAVRERRPVVLLDVSQEQDLTDLAALYRDAGIVSVCAVPLIGGDEALGGIEVYTDRPRSFTDEELDLLSIFANQAAVALNNAALHDSARRRLDELSALFDAMETMSATAELEDIMQFIIAQVLQLFPADAAHISLVDENLGRLHLAISRGIEQDRIHKHRELNGIDHQLCWAIKKDKPFVVRDAEKDFACRQLITRGQSQSYVCSPLTAGGKTFGVMHMSSHRRAGFGASHVRLFTTLADQVAIATQRAQLFRRIEQLAQTDALTGLHNVRYFREALQQEMIRSGRTGRPLSLIMFDIDHFKHHNDAYGHPSGDALLKKLTETASTVLRNIDIFSRYGGEEFTVLLPDTDTEGAARVAEKLRAAVEAETFYGNSEHPEVKKTISLGVATCPVHATAPPELIDAADAALYRAKEGGRNRVCVAG